MPTVDMINLKTWMKNNRYNYTKYCTDFNLKHNITFRKI